MSASTIDLCYESIVRAVDSTSLCMSPHTWGQLLTGKLCHTLLIACQNSWGTPIRSCLKGQDVGERQENLEGNT